MGGIFIRGNVTNSVIQNFGGGNSACDNCPQGTMRDRGNRYVCDKCGKVEAK